MTEIREMFRSSSAVRNRVLLTLIVWTGLLVCLYSMASDPHEQWDFQVYYSAAHTFVHGGNPYHLPRSYSGLSGDVVVYQYPPLTLYVFLWTNLLSLAAGKLAWLGLKLAALGALLWVWHKDFERLDASWPSALFIALGFNATVLRDFTCGNISTFEQLGLWLGFSLLLRDRPYAAAMILACVAQFKLLPVAFIGMIPLSRPNDGWKPCLAGFAVFLALLALNPLCYPDLTHNYLGLFADTNPRMDDRGVHNPSSLSMFRDLIDLTAFVPGLPYNSTAGTRAYVAYLVALVLVLTRAALNMRGKLRDADPRLALYFGCAVFAVAVPRMKDYSYILMLIPALFVIRNIARRGLTPDYFLLGLALLIWAQPQQDYVPGMEALIYMIQAYLPLFISAAIMIYVLRLWSRQGPAPVRAPATG
jgi:hypothetical protein